MTEELKTNECPICYENIDRIVLLECKHEFCRDCLVKIIGFKWLRGHGTGTCPLCRRENITSIEEMTEIIDDAINLRLEGYTTRMTPAVNSLRELCLRDFGLESCTDDMYKHSTLIVLLKTHLYHIGVSCPIRRLAYALIYHRLLGF